ncbi:hypothetical protein I7I53_06234 [Histoplasma capsulatum var. duboisii H88]|uniref:Uncharacterized protein n=1 Tax=Ajellomyces capsulatus (strain H88) TaxID=544711 RepID=A0A8A1LAM8_AJEC8|nr:hypothetical protein I7I53_06234 [Histoplasma capsulatum var. duboisii H88]
MPERPVPVVMAVRLGSVPSYAGLTSHALTPARHQRFWRTKGHYQETFCIKYVRWKAYIKMLSWTVVKDEKKIECLPELSVNF